MYSHIVMNPKGIIDILLVTYWKSLKKNRYQGFWLGLGLVLIFSLHP